jgi:hypothetical protein
VGSDNVYVRSEEGKWRLYSAVLTNREIAAAEEMLYVDKVEFEFSL